jgi:ParB-like chromosome segregation protein Spo0J
MKQIGLISPICVRRVTRHRGTTPFDAFEIVAGGHRYSAALQLRWSTIACDVVEFDDLHAELAEIDENLIRCNLTPAQEASAISRRKAIYEELHPETKHGGDRKSDQVANSATRFTEATADATGKAERTIRQAAARGEVLGDDLNDIAGTSLDKGVELDALAKMGASERKVIIDRAKDGEDVSARAPRIDGDIKNRAAQELAEWIVGHANGNDLDAVKANLFAAGAKNIAVELTNLIGQSIMDRRFS